METPKNVRELVDRLVTLEAEVEKLKKENRVLRAMNESARQLVIVLRGLTTKKSNFTNYEVKQHATSIHDALTKKPLLR